METIGNGSYWDLEQCPLQMSNTRAVTLHLRVLHKRLYCIAIDNNIHLGQTNFISCCSDTERNKLEQATDKSN